MSASAATLTAAEYESRRSLLEDIKTLSRVEQEEIYRIIKGSSVEYSENHNGVFFDVCKLPADMYEKIQAFLAFCKKNRDDFAAREEDERAAQEALLQG